jgi:hypothetical protein
VIVDGKGDLDFTPCVAPLAELVLPTVSPDLAKLRASEAPQLHALGKQRNRHRTDELSTNGATNGTAPTPMGRDVNEHSAAPSGNFSVIERRLIKRKESELAGVDSRLAESREGESTHSSKRNSLPNDFRNGGIFDSDLLAKWKRLRREVESPRPTVGRHQRSRTVGNARIPEGQQTSPISTSSRGSSLQSGSWSQLHRGGRDRTNTDYFRLKARGIEKLPGGSVVPAAVKTLPKKRPYATAYGDADSSQRPAQKKVLVKENVAQDASASVNSTAGGSDEEDEELFAEARKIMGTITEGIEFYREETRRVMSRSNSGERF